MGYWKTKVLPKIKKLFSKGKKQNAAEVVKAFEQSKESLSEELEDSDGKLRFKVVELYKTSNTNAKMLLREPTEKNLADHHAEVPGLLKGLAKAGCPGAESLSTSVTKFGSALFPGPVTFLLDKVSVYVKDEPCPGALEDSHPDSVENGVTEPTIVSEATNEIIHEVQEIEAVPISEKAHQSEIEVDSETAL